MSVHCSVGSFVVSTSSPSDTITGTIVLKDIFSFPVHWLEARFLMLIGDTKQSIRVFNKVRWDLVLFWVTRRSR